MSVCEGSRTHAWFLLSPNPGRQGAARRLYSNLTESMTSGCTVGNSPPPGPPPCSSHTALHARLHGERDHGLIQHFGLDHHRRARERRVDLSFSIFMLTPRFDPVSG